MYNIFVTLPSWPLDRNKSELEIFSKYYNNIDKESIKLQMIHLFDNDSVKNEHEANVTRTKGNAFYHKLDYEQAIKLYNESICLAPRDSTEFGLAVANRSAALFDMGKYKECLEDLTIVLKSEYPKDLICKIYLRQSKCYLKLNMNFEATKSVRKLQENINQQTLKQSLKSSIEDKILEIKHQIKEQLEIKPTDKQSIDNIYFQPTLKDGENPNFLNASNIVEYRNTKKRGRHVVAKTEIKKGDVLFMEEPYSYIPLKSGEYNSDICTLCFKKVLNFVPCIKCVKHVYCSDKCRQQSWDLNHQWMCLAEKQEAIISDTHLLALTMLLDATRDGFVSTVSDNNVYGNKENNFAFINKLLTNKGKLNVDALKDHVQAAIWIVEYLRNFTDYFEKLYLNPNRPEGSKEDLYVFIGSQILMFILQINCNEVVILERDVLCTPVQFTGLMCVTLGIGIYTSAALLNHCCIPNAVKSFHGTKLVVTAAKDMKKGTEITINYLIENYYETEPIVRMLQLKNHYFTCNCEACSNSNMKEKVTPYKCLDCGNKLFIKSDQIFVECVTCAAYIHTFYFFINAEKIKCLLFISPGIECDVFFDDVGKLMKETYHKHNARYFDYYEKCLQFYIGTDKIKKCLDISKLLKDLYENTYKEICDDSMLNYARNVYFLAKYCVKLKQQNSKNYKKFYDEIVIAIKECADIMQYFLRPQRIHNFFDYIEKYLNSNNIQININNCLL